jgi:hypothetical protein
MSGVSQIVCWMLPKCLLASTLYFVTMVLLRRSVIGLFGYPVTGQLRCLMTSLLRRLMTRLLRCLMTSLLRRLMTRLLRCLMTSLLRRLMTRLLRCLMTSLLRRPAACPRDPVRRTREAELLCNQPQH